MELETVWNGASWREVPAPPLAPPPLARVRDTYRARPSQVGAKAQQALSRARVRACLADGQWWSTTTVAAAIGLSDVRTVVHLTHGVTTGLFERREATNCRRRGRRGYLYRLSQTNTQTDTLTETQDHDPTNDPDHPCA